MSRDFIADVLKKRKKKTLWGSARRGYGAPVLRLVAGKGRLNASWVVGRDYIKRFTDRGTSQLLLRVASPVFPYFFL